MKYKYNVVYRLIDYDAEKKVYFFTNWKSACKFMKSLLVDGYVILEVNG